jgi:hypothetical protein
MWYVVALIWLALVAGIFWAYGRRRRQAVSARTRELSELIAEARQSARAPAPEPGAAAVKTEAAAAERFARRGRLLDKADAWLYALFRAGLPDHEIFADIALARVVQPETELRGDDHHRRRQRLAQTALNVVVCNRQLEVVAVALYPARDAAEAEAQRYAEYCLAAAGVRLIRIDPSALPRHHQLRALVYGEAAAAG